MAQDPDTLLQRLMDATGTELRRIRANARLIKAGPGGGSCESCQRDFGMSDAERKFLIDAGKLVTAVAFGARRIIADRLLRSLSEGQLQAFERGIEEREGPWLPKP